MEATFENLPEAVKIAINEKINSLYSTVREESAKAFESIAANFSNYDIYHLGLYYPEGSWTYLIPTFSTEEGLSQVASQYAKHSVIDIDENKISLRWSFCDSPHHGEHDTEDMLKATQLLLDELDEILDSYQSLNNPGVDEIWLQTLDEIHEMLRFAVIKALSEIYTSPPFCNMTPGLVMSLCAGDMDNERLLENIRLIGGNSAYLKVSAELSAAEAIQQLEYDAMEAKLAFEAENPPTTNLTLDDFIQDIESFSLEFQELNGGIYLNKKPEYPLDGSSESESSFNRIAFMDVLRESKHYEEVDQLYGHFIGKNFRKGDLFPMICQKLADRLTEALRIKFPNINFMIYLIVDRGVLYHMTFCIQRDDGFEFDRYLLNSDEGVEEIRIIRSSDH